MKVKYLGGLLLTVLLCVYGCSDNTSTLGISMLPGSDAAVTSTTTFDVTTRSFQDDKVYAKTSTGYLGRYTDPSAGGFGSYEASFLTELNCTDKYTFPAEYEEYTDENGVKRGTGYLVPGSKVEEAQLVVYYNSWFGDSLNTCRMSAYQLNQKWVDERSLKDPKFRYTNFDIAAYKGDLLSSRAYTAYDASISDSLRSATDSNGNKVYSPHVILPIDTRIAQNIVDLNRKYEKGENNYFDNAEQFIKNVFSGIYLKSDYGDGTILYVEQVALMMQFQVHYVDSLGVKLTKQITDANGEAGTDSIAHRSSIAFASTKEVIQSNNFSNSSELLAERAEEPDHTYLKSPEGIFTEATLPCDEIYEQLANDTLNTVKLTFTNYHQDNSEYEFSMSAPTTVLLLRKKDLHSFFEENSLTDNITSFIATHNSVATNQYTFSNIARLIMTCRNEIRAAQAQAGASWNKEQWLKENEDWNKVVLIPVSLTYNTSSSTQSVIGIQHDLKPSVVKLKGGDPNQNGSKLQLEVTYTSFQ